MVKSLGIELIANERSNQISNGKPFSFDKRYNRLGQLRYAALVLLQDTPEEYPVPEGWDIDQWSKHIVKSLDERLVIAGALIAAEIDRLVLPKELSK
jgi:hypothetical protein